MHVAHDIFTVLHLDAAEGSTKFTTATFMAPEVHDPYVRDIPSGALTHDQGLADIYSVGISMWRLLVGRDAFRRGLKHKGQLQLAAEDRGIRRLYLKAELVSFNSHTLQGH